jgi:flagellar hook-basal body complex protein FliE
MSAVAGVGGAGAFSPLTAPSLTQSTGGATGGAGGAAKSSFANGLSSVEKSISAADTAATQVATGTATDLHQVTVAATKAQLGVQMTVALRNRAVEAYQEIMRMSV